MLTDVSGLINDQRLCVSRPGLTFPLGQAAQWVRRAPVRERGRSLVVEMSIGEFARRSRLSPKALPLYEGLGLLSPARVDDLSGYRYYESARLEQARLIATLRHVGVPLATVKEWLALDPAEIAERVRASWREAEAHHAVQRQLAAVLVDRLTGGAPSCTKSRPGRCRDAACCA
jgi:DNA-binding transcriptional MerR regulator